jgi:seryl-tRNA synthetase
VEKKAQKFGKRANTTKKKKERKKKEKETLYLAMGRVVAEHVPANHDEID